MKKTINISLIFCFLLITVYSFSQNTEELYLLKKLKSITEDNIIALEHTSVCKEKYQIKITQPLDHNNPEAGNFTQRVFLSFNDLSKPVVFITEGYSASYAKNPAYQNELTNIIDANEICVEHRFFGESLPDSLDWKYLTVEQAANDHHNVIELLKKIYHGKWVSTGISKGGQTCMYHRYFFPDDVDASIPYVAPLNFASEDPRAYTFLENVGDSTCRAKIYNYQKTMLEGKKKYLPKFKKLAHKKNLHYSMGLEAAFELTVLEYPFAFWQWGTFNCNSIPTDLSAKKMINHLDKVAGIDWVSEEGVSKLLPFFYQAMTEIGFYGYDTTNFPGLITALKKPDFYFTCPENTTCAFNPDLMKKVDAFIRHEAQNMIFIYGEADPWSSTSVDLTGRKNMIKMVKKGGSHRTRIRSFYGEEKEKIYKSLEKWLNLKIIR